MKRRKKNKELKNCLGCGRDTGGSSGYCKSCIYRGTVNFNENKDRGILRFGSDPISWWTPLHEDRYDEDYFPKDVER